MTEPVAPPSAGTASDRCPRHDFPLDAAGCALCRQEAAAKSYAGGGGAPAPAIVPRGKRDPAVWIVGGALTFAGCVMPLAIGTVLALLAWLLFGAGARLACGVGLAGALLTLVVVLKSK